MEQKVFWDERHASSGWWVLKIGDLRVTVEDCQKCGINTDRHFCYSGRMPSGNTTLCTDLKAKTIEEAKIELLTIYLDRFKTENRHYREMIENNNRCIEEICLMIKNDSKKKETI